MATFNPDEYPMSKMDFPRTINVEEWNNYLGRVGMKLSPQDLNLFERVRTENRFNSRLEKLHQNAKHHKLYIPALTNLYGNCLFESLEYHYLIDNPNEFREDLAFMMYLFGEVEDFFPEQKESLKTLFSLYNEVETVICKQDGVHYKYTYETMCKDLASDFSWTRLNTELIMRVMAFIFGKYFVVVNIEDHNKVLIYYPNSTYAYVQTIPDEIYNSENAIYLGLIGEIHYVPLSYNNNIVPDTYPKYNDCRITFFKWARVMFFKVHYDIFAPYFQKLKEEREKQEKEDREEKEYKEVEVKKTDNLVNFNENNTDH